MKDNSIKKEELREIIEGFRKDSEVSNLERFKLDITPIPKSGWNYDKNAWNRAMLILELFEKNERADKPLIKWLLDEEIKGQEFEILYYALDVNAYLLYKHMDDEDVYQLYNSKFGFANVFHLDVELIFGYDREKMKQYLKDTIDSNPMNSEILKTISDYESNPDAKFKTRSEYIEYYENRKIKHIRNDIESSRSFMESGK